MAEKFTPENLTGWMYAKQFLSELYDYEYLADTWPQRLGIEDIAALQTGGKEYPVFEAWKVSLEKAVESGELVSQPEQWWRGNDKPSEFWTEKKQSKLILIPPCHKNQGDDVLFFHGELISRDTVSPIDFADYLRKINEQPSKYIAAWFDVFGIETNVPKPLGDVTEGNEDDKKRLNAIHMASFHKTRHVSERYTKNNRRIDKLLIEIMVINPASVEYKNKTAELEALMMDDIDTENYQDTIDKIIESPELPENSSHDDRVERYAWLIFLNKWNELFLKTAQIDKQKQVEQLIIKIKKQLGLIVTNNDVKSKVNKKFVPFNNLRANQISIVMMNDNKAKIVIKSKQLDIVPCDLGLKANSQGWKLLEQAALEHGDLKNGLSSLNKTSNQEKEKAKIRTAISRLNKELQESIGLQDAPIIFDSNGYRFNFQTMTHELMNDKRVIQGEDAMQYLDKNDFNEEHYSSPGNDSYEDI